MLSPLRGRPAQALVVLGGYVVGGLLGLQLASVADAVTLVWPPTGIAIAALVLGGRALVLPVFLGAAIVNALVGASPLAALAIAGGNTLEAVVAAALLSRTGFDPGFASRRDVASFALWAGVAAPTVAAMVGASVLLATGSIPPSQWLPTAGLWWAGDATGALIVGPLLLTWARPARPTSALAWASMLLWLAGSAVAAFATPSLSAPLRSALSVVPVAALVWAALRLGARGAATACALLSAIAVVGTATTGGPLEGGEGLAAGVPLWLFSTLSAVLALLLTALNSERSRAEDATARSEARFAAAFRDAPIGMAVVTRDGRVLEANPQMASMLGVEAEELLGARLDRWVPDLSYRLAARLLAASGEAPARSFPIRRASGELRTWQVRASHLSSDGLDRTVLIQAEDVTEELRAADSVRALTEQLAHAQRMESIGQLAGGIAHDFNNLLQAIGANVELARLRGDEPPVRDEVLGHALEAVELARSLTGQLLAFSRRAPTHRVPTDLRDTLERCRHLLERLLPEDVELIMEPPDHAACALVDDAQIEQVLVNLCLNARDAMPDGGRIELRLWTSEDWVHVTASDDGPGVPPELRSRIFEPFFTTKPRGRGTGFGLAVAFGIVRAHEGHIEVDDRPGGGARFTVRLPRTALHPAPRPAPEEERAAPPLRVLVAEDEPAVRAVLCRMLRAEGHQVVEAEDGSRAVELFREQVEAIDLLLFDVRMPRMTGPEAIRRIRSVRPDVPALLMSGYTSDELASPSEHLRVELLAKPYSRSALLGAVDRATHAPPARSRPVRGVRV